ncbi:macrophage migration inhibitory factor-like [Maniola jurtina]|uniref:macrophage migration inhibitory factor-like n=1 Tax=Maniola jurtina TaxID=191418 RepID=UPI001E68CD2F|nr:macrophage migration inhibitory factor-like [Maniola jurtina]
MPVLKIFTNVPKSQVTKDFMAKVIPVLVDGVKKEAEKFTCMVQGDCLLSIDGDSTLPAATASLESIGHLGPEENKRIAKLLSAVMQSELGVKPGRFLLTFYDLEPHNIAKNGTTIATLEF